MDESAATNDAEDSPDSSVEGVSFSQPAWLSSFAALLPVMMCFLGTGRTAWAYGLAAAIIGVLALVFPPKGRVPVSLLGVAAVIALFTLLPMIPLPWPHWPAWRHSLMEDYQLALSPTWSVQPLITLENWCSMLVLGLWFFWAVCRSWPSDHRISAMRILAGGFLALSVTALVCKFIGWKPPGWNPSLTDIGPYANRNHFSCLMAMTALLCLAAAYELQRRKNRLWTVFALGVIPTFAVTVLNTSRAGLVLFFIGTMMWFLTSSTGGSGGSMGRKASRMAVRLAITISLMFVLIAGVVLFGRPLLKRFAGKDASVTQTLVHDSRMAVYAKAWPLAADQPVMGVGLGNFGTVFALVHDLPNAYARYRHPESDWLWFLCEAGWPATFAMLLAVGLIISWMEPWKASSEKKGRRERRLRRAAGLAFLLSIGHGIVDTSNHDLPHLLLVILLGALALRPSRLARTRGISAPWLFRIGGLAALVASGVWFATGAGVATPFGLSRSTRDIEKARTLLAQGQAQGAMEHASRAIIMAPLHWEPYFMRAQAALKLGHPENEAMEDFGRARCLEPHVTQICMAEGMTWLAFAPNNALPAWREALRRDPPEGNHLYRVMLDAIIPYPELRAPIRDLANRPGLLVIYLSTANGSEVNETLQLILQRYPALDGMVAYERQIVLSRWLNSGDHKALAAFLEAHPNLPDTWQVRARLLAEEGKVETAFKLLQQYINPPVSNYFEQSNLAQMERDFQLHPSDPKRGLALYAVQRDKGLWDAALATLDKIAGLPGRPKHVFFETALMHAQKGDYPKAWELAQQYLDTPE
ncbi:MAG: O-antigen ligase family protein [Verrucomicrobiaceae bacterium]|nr:O-antigen ligase family protein [Verrucomicrobiaceae bacterium]